MSQYVTLANYGAVPVKVSLSSDVPTAAGVSDNDASVLRVAKILSSADDGSNMISLPNVQEFLNRVLIQPVGSSDVIPLNTLPRDKSLLTGSAYVINASVSGFNSNIIGELKYTDRSEKKKYIVGGAIFVSVNDRNVSLVSMDDVLDDISDFSNEDIQFALPTTLVLSAKVIKIISGSIVGNNTSSMNSSSSLPSWYQWTFTIVVMLLLLVIAIISVMTGLGLSKYVHKTTEGVLNYAP